MTTAVDAGTRAGVDEFCARLACWLDEHAEHGTDAFDEALERWLAADPDAASDEFFVRLDAWLGTADVVSTAGRPFDDVPSSTGESSGDRRHIRRVAIATAILGLVLAVRTFAVEPVRVRSDSMEPTLHDGDVVVVDHLSARWRDPHRGDIVTTEHPLTGEAIVKRVVAVGGDSVGIVDGVLVVNGREVAEPYADQTEMDGNYFGPIDVPPGSVFLLGDHRLTSTDSRAFGPVDVDDIDGIVRGHVWPIGGHG